ncbi:hypothetical protein A3D42_00200 [Candidatus Nomurabacteria bacterium RIFCSPHIGHO2_02_FULL_41_18]|uniref:Uncharacterized protein n=1 Tax=Candidatus Nomurabacteria bacterium RIFCSPHIGHO2_02_FULL_41_18 TaxID=1801754 RepID=A0A1F6W7B8_9BACT|nr:MAG: hypothetical protein A2737_03035 [Candidatus Nomurabacteria bacterium RIFCSPHIGHO2_01_FULL_41_71]OGI77692.1 MAG: hypothetical protein A3D42_00200 [Candidatus Nomurabacteria bacterium RIFCSPHIGHO2_02_FULL_41_18]OGI89027.1 MAG: hypothetical protein A3B01_00410 [Candidatus Nomurabacteria bacterium RIFCSPLOWO2_01_FULL_41_52b]OGJ00368.1 MAG: hypothetical protein A3I90_00725 [Candidatus Nomurabacteria bacterium RIFCSPLOWO2_02_FULL_41_9]
MTIENKPGKKSNISEAELSAKAEKKPGISEESRRLCIQILERYFENPQKVFVFIPEMAGRLSPLYQQPIAVSEIKDVYLANPDKPHFFAALVLGLDGKTRSEIAESLKFSPTKRREIAQYFWSPAIIKILKWRMRSK